MSNQSLFDSIKSSDISLAQSLLKKKKTNTNIRNDKGETPLHLAINLQNIEMTKLLIKNGADINAKIKEQEDSSPLHYAIKKENIEITTLLVKKGADVNNSFKYKGLSPLGMAIDQFGWNSTKSIFKSNKDISLYFALNEKNETITKDLIKKGANIKQMDDNLNTALHLASKTGNLELAKLCIKKGALVNFKNSMKKSPMDYAKSKEMEKLLKSHGGTISSSVDKTIGLGKKLIIRVIIFIFLSSFIIAMFFIIKLCLKILKTI